MALKYHPPTGTIVTANFDEGFIEPEMVKRRLAIVISPNIENRFGLCTIVPLSTSPPEQEMDYHAKIVIPFQLPAYWGPKERWIKGDMIYSAGFHRLDLLKLGKDRSGKRIYQTKTLPSGMMKIVNQCVLNGLGFGNLTEHL